MTYGEFCNTYRCASKRWPDCISAIQNRTFSTKLTCLRQTKQHYSKWHTTAVLNDDEVIDGPTYLRTIDAVDWFENVFEDGKEIVYTADTRYGELPVKLISLSPDGLDRYIFTFKFE